MARMALAGVNGRIETTIGPRNGPAGTVSMLVRYMATFLPSATWRTGTPAAISASSKENEQPSAKATMSSLHSGAMSVTSSTNSPSR